MDHKINDMFDKLRMSGYMVLHVEGYFIVCRSDKKYILRFPDTVMFWELINDLYMDYKNLKQSHHFVIDIANEELFNTFRKDLFSKYYLPI